MVATNSPVSGIFRNLSSCNRISSGSLMQKQGLASKEEKLTVLDPSGIFSDTVKLNLHCVPHHLVAAVWITWSARVSVTKVYWYSLWSLEDGSCAVHGAVALRSPSLWQVTLEQYVLETCTLCCAWKRPCQDECENSLSLLFWEICFKQGI